MINTTKDPLLKKTTLKYLCGYFQIEKPFRENWYEGLACFATKNNSQNCTDQMIIEKVRRPKDRVINLGMCGHKSKLKLIFSRKGEERFVYSFPDSDCYFMLMVMAKGKSYVEMFICKSGKCDKNSFKSKLEAGNVETDLMCLRTKYDGPIFK
jgi:hypothetical protein